MTRQTKTPQQRAEEALEVADRKIKRAEDKLVKARAEVTGLETELTDLRRRRTYLADDPALPVSEPDYGEPVVPSEGDES